MEKPNSYCEYVASLDNDNIHRIYHDTQYGFPIESDDELFCRLTLEINQAGLSWTTILNKQDNFRKAYSNFNIEVVAKYDNVDITRLLSNPGIIRNRLKINAAINNARKIVELKNTFGSFRKWLDKNHPLTIEQWVRLFKMTFKFTGGEITKEFLLSTGYLRGAHVEGCYTYNIINEKKPMWLK
ncbi:MAG: DNA-3-methyladenine glycosylase [Lentimicrobiaceae bacterium]|jgi:DNA-3-methyladenine glycosylase I|nr:DNA-3-methyladenine glycosylase [Lentimicrobiaceae bacterium]|tara:strand:- start:15845 stop:16396 length:552 start_codon:yes stop_codon:yes gene_type:complete